MRRHFLILAVCAFVASFLVPSAHALIETMPCHEELDTSDEASADISGSAHSGAMDQRSALNDHPGLTGCCGEDCSCPIACVSVTHAMMQEPSVLALARVDRSYRPDGVGIGDESLRDRHLPPPRSQA